jgi:hypothetical protein
MHGATSCRPSAFTDAAIAVSLRQAAERYSAALLLE